MKKLIKIHLVLVICLICLASTLSAQRGRPAPPPPPVVVMGPPPNPSYIWIPGHWKWSRRAHNYIWRDGHWAAPRRVRVHRVRMHGRRY